MTRFTIIGLLLTTALSCTAAKKTSVDKTSSKDIADLPHYTIDSTKINKACLTSNGITFPIVPVKSVADNKKHNYYKAALCLHNDVKDGDKDASIFYDEIYIQWVVKKIPHNFLVDSMAKLYTKVAFDYLVKFLNVDTQYGSNDVMPWHDGLKMYDNIFPYLEISTRNHYISQKDKIYWEVINANYKKYKIVDNQKMDYPEIHKKFRELFLADLKNGKIKLRADIK